MRLQWAPIVCTVSICAYVVKWLNTPLGDRIPAPEGWLPRHLQYSSLNRSQLETLKRDGVLVLPKYLPEDICDELWRHFVTNFGNYQSTVPHHPTTNTWLVDEALQTLLREGPFGATLSDAYGGLPVHMASSNWWYRGGPHGGGGWHYDDDAARQGADTTQYIMWVAVTDAPDSLDYLLGSHLDPIQNYCFRNGQALKGDDFALWLYGPEGQKCHTNEWAAGLSEKRSEPALRTYNFSRGDAVIFHGMVAHRGRGSLPGRERLGLSFQTYPGNTKFENEIMNDGGQLVWFRHLPGECSALGGPVFPQIYPHHNSTLRLLLPTRFDSILRFFVELAYTKGLWTFKHCPGSKLYDTSPRNLR